MVPKCGEGGEVAAALVAAEAVLRAGIDKDLDAGLRGLDRRNIGHRDGGVLLPEMQLHGAARRGVLTGHDATAIPAIRGPKTGAAGRAPPGDGAAPAIADDAALCALGQGGGGGLDIGERTRFRHMGAELAAAGDVIR